MKKIVAAMTAALLAGALSLSLSACSLFEIQPDGKFPYDVATEHGYDGSEESWLSSTETPSTQSRRMYDEAVADGSFTGTYYEFLQSLSWNMATDDSAAVNRALASAVRIESEFRTASGAKASLGSGVVYSLDKAAGDAYIVTNFHVIYSAESTGRESVKHVSDDISLWLYGGETESRAIEATFVGGAMAYDIAVLKVEDSAVLKESSARAVVAADSDSVTVGERVYAVGNADGEGISATGGIVSVGLEYIQILASDDVTPVSIPEIRTDAAVNHGNSGGGLFNAGGELVGIVNARSEADGVESFGYAIPANVALAVAQNILDNAAGGSMSALRATLGVTVRTADGKGVYDEQTGKYYIEEKIVVDSVSSGKAGARAGLDVGDTVVAASLRSADGTVTRVDITRRVKLDWLLFQVRRGDTLTLTVTRAGEAEALELIVDFSSSSDFTQFGLTV